MVIKQSDQLFEKPEENNDLDKPYFLFLHSLNKIAKGELSKTPNKPKKVNKILELENPSVKSSEKKRKKKLSSKNKKKKQNIKRKKLKTIFTSEDEKENEEI